MTPAAPFFLLASAVLLVGAAVAPPVAPEPPPAPEVATEEAPAEEVESDYTTRMSQPPLVGEYDPATAPPPPPYAAAPDEDGLRQCLGPDGVPIFTDRRCEDLGAIPQPAPAAGAAYVAPGLVRVRTCARNQDALLSGVRAALDSHDANRLADYYHWTGMGSTEAYRLMERLATFSARPVVDVQLVHAARPEADPYADPWFDAAPPPSPFDDFDPEAPDGIDTPAPPPPRRQLAFLLRVDQMRGESDAASTVTYFRLLTNAGCWWMRF